MADLDELRALLAEATPGPWRFVPNQEGQPEWDGDIHGGNDLYVAHDHEGLHGAVEHADAALIVWLRNHAESLLDDSLDVERLARAIHRTGIAYCRDECGPVDAPYSGADADMAVFLAREYASESPEGKTP